MEIPQMSPKLVILGDIFKKILRILFFREGKGEREGEKYQCVVASHAPPTEDLLRNPGICPRLGIEPVTL